MKRRFGIRLVAAVWVLSALTAAADDFSPSAYAGLPDWENPYVTSSNRLNARAVFVSAASREQARDIASLRAPRTDSPYVMSLDGEWDFEWQPSPDGYGRVERVERVDTKKHGKIAVPGCWQLQGDYDPPIYTNVRYPHVKHPPYIMEDPPTNYTSYVYRNPVGTYRRTFAIPAEWNGRRIVLHFGGVYSAFYVRVNGVTVGYSEDSRLPAEFDVTEFLTFAEKNEIEVEVYRWCDGSYLEDQDFWRMSGIYRGVRLVAERPDGLRDIVIEPTVSEDLKTGELSVSFDCESPVRARIVSPDGKTESNVVNGKLHVDNPILWDCDSPNLYTLEVEAAGDYFAFPVGFRRIEIKDSVLKINNRRILVKGVNRHEMSATGGYTVTLDEMKRDVAALKSINANAVRTCHYPNDPDWYTLCDQNGIYVWAEANIESHGMGFGGESLAHRADYLLQHIERDVRMVRTLRNHPSIIVWSQGNEAGCGVNFAKAREAIRALDPSRPVQYENRTYTREDRSGTTDINCPMYRTPDQCREYLSDSPEMPLIQCEYAHAMGNSTGGFADFWAFADRYDSFQGGFIWDFADQGLWKSVKCKMENGKLEDGMVLAYGGDFGDMPNDGNGHCNGLFDPFRNPHPGAFEVAHVHGLFPNSYPDPKDVKLVPLLADLKVEPCFWRAPTDNDRGHKLVRNNGVWRSSEGVKVDIVRRSIDARTMRLDVVFELPQERPYAPRVGVAISLPASATNLCWRGRGPHENYPDRKFGASVGGWSADISAPPPYIRPQDYGHYCDTTSLTLGPLSVKCIFTSTPREGLKDTFGFAAWPWTIAELESARHNEELPTSSGVTLVLDADIMGVGGDDSWSRIAAPRPPHRPQVGTYTLTVELSAR